MTADKDVSLPSDDPDGGNADKCRGGTNYQARYELLRHGHDVDLSIEEVKV